MVLYRVLLGFSGFNWVFKGSTGIGYRCFLFVVVAGARRRGRRQHVGLLRLPLRQRRRFDLGARPPGRAAPVAPPPGASSPGTLVPKSKKIPSGASASWLRPTEELLKPSFTGFYLVLPSFS